MKALDFFFAARPLLHLPVWSIYLVSLHYHFQFTNGRFEISNLGMMILLSVVSAAAYYLNQVFDFRSDRANDKLGFLQKSYIGAKSMQIWCVILSSFALVGAFLFSTQMLAVFGQLVLLGYLYSAPPFRLKDRPFWGLFANAYGFGALIVFTIMPNIDIHNLGLLGWDNPFYFMFAVGGIYILTTIPDAPGDRATGKRTIAVVWGTKPALVLALLLEIGAVYTAWHSQFSVLFYIAAISVMAILGALMVSGTRAILFAAKLPILLLTLLAGYFFPIYLVFIVALVFLTRIYYSRRFQIIYPRLA